MNRSTTPWWLLVVLMLGPVPESAAQDPDRPVWHALVIGLTSPAAPGLGTRPDAGDDAREVARLLVEGHGLDRRNVRLLADEEATRGKLLGALQRWACDPERVGPADRLLVYVSVPVVQREDAEPAEFLVPYDGRMLPQRPAWKTLVPVTELWQLAGAFPGREVVFLVDAAARPPDPPPACMVLPGTPTGPEPGRSLGALLIPALQGAADLNCDGALTVRELVHHLTFDDGSPGRPSSSCQDQEADLVLSGSEPVDRAPADVRLRRLRGTAEQQLTQLELLADGALAKELLRDAATLWPRVPEKVAAMEDWLARAAEVRSRVARHRDGLRRVHQEAYLTQVADGTLVEGETLEPDWSRTGPVLRWRHRSLRELVADHSSLDQVHADVVARHQVASTLWQRSIGDHQEQWREAIEAIAASPHYGGLRIEPQVGLVPLGVDPDTGLWEFWEVTSGECPLLGVPDGTVPIQDESGMVFVLLPGGPCIIGAQKDDPDGPHYDLLASADERITRPTLEPFLISKYEMTQGQWFRITGRRPSFYGAATLGADHHPVEMVSWDEGAQVLARLGMAYPTEAQWEYAARGGTDTPWWCGEDAASIARTNAGNLLDRSAKRHAATRTWDVHEEWDDGHMVHAPVAAHAANPFGLCGVIGNVWEWCADLYVAPDRLPDNPDTGERETRICRGGGFFYTATHGRSSARHHHEPSYRSFNVGLRPVMPLR